MIIKTRQKEKIFKYLTIFKENILKKQYFRVISNKYLIKVNKENKEKIENYL